MFFIIIIYLFFQQTVGQLCTFKIEQFNLLIYLILIEQATFMPWYLKAFPVLY